MWGEGKEGKNTYKKGSLCSFAVAGKAREGGREGGSSHTRTQVLLLLLLLLLLTRIGSDKGKVYEGE